jgi:hypothetical protein
MIKQVYIIFYIALFNGAFMDISFAQNPSEEKAVASKVYYYKNLFGHLHLAPYSFSSSLTTIACGFPIKTIIKERDKLFISNDWLKAELGGQKGFVYGGHLSSSKPDCLQERYTGFFNILSLDLEDLYYWGRLYDQYNLVDTNL